MNRYGELLRPPVSLRIEYSYAPPDPVSVVFHRASDENGTESSPADYHLMSLQHAFLEHLKKEESR